MAISTRSRFILISVSITVLSLLLFTSVLYDKAVKFKHLQEASSYDVLTEQYLMLTVDKEEPDKIRSVFAEHITSNLLPAVLYATLDKQKNIKFLFERENLKKYLITKVIPELNKNNPLFQGQINVEGQNYYYLVKDISSYSTKEDLLVVIFPLSSYVVTEVLDIFGLPFYISGFILLWMMVWTSIILSSLVTKLQDQKAMLSEQAVYIKHAYDDALNANAAKSYFLANMSHEIRTPLTSIIGFAEESLKTDSTVKERTHATETIIKSGYHLLNLINEILDLSKVEAGKIELEEAPVKLFDMLEEVNEFVSVLAREKGLAFGINQTYPLPKTIITDPLRLKQILLNICSNAIKFTNRGYVYLNVSYIPASNKMCFEIIDTGIGMDKEQLEKVFKPFAQADQSTTREYGGTGLGLTLSKKLTDMLNGELVVESEVNKGSRFTVLLPIQKLTNTDYIYDDSEKKFSEAKVATETEVPQLTGKILVAEDNPDIQSLVKLLLRKVGVNLDMVENGKVAIEKALENEYDVIFLDIQMPVLDGIMAVKELRKSGYTKTIIAMTANAMKQDIDECMQAGFDDFISKPINRSILYKKLSECLKHDNTVQGDNMITSDLLEEEADLIDLIDKFMTRLPAMRDSINAAYAEKDWDLFSDLVHQLKGVGGGYGYPMLTEMCTSIESMKNNNENIDTLMEDFNLMCDEILAGNDENHKIAEANM